MNAASQSSSRGLFAEIVRLQRAGRRAVLAIPLWSRGSVPLRHHSKLLCRDDGSTRGTIGGGLLEAKVLEAAPGVLSGRELRVLEFDLSPAEAAESGMLCGGRCAVFLEPIAPDYHPDIFAAAARAEEAAEPIVLITILRLHSTARKLALTSQDELLGSTGDQDLDEDLRGLAGNARGEQKPSFVEHPLPVHLDPILPHPTLLVFGAGHISLSLAHMAALIGFRVVVIDDRADFANPQRFPRADHVLVASPADAFRQLPIDHNSYLVAVTRGHAMDEEVVAHALDTSAKYIGMIGSKRKVAEVRRRLKERGFSDDQLARLHAPIGLDVGAETVEEIAVSILAELIAVRRTS